MTCPRIILKAGRDESLRRHHPWVFTGGIERVEGDPDSGATVDVVTSDGAWRARGAWSPASQMRVRAWTFDEHQQVDAAFLRTRLERALALRRALSLDGPEEACRLVNAESDGLPGLIVDRYGPWLVCQFQSAGAESWRESIIEALAGLGPWRGIFERSDTDSRTKEGLAERVGRLSGDEPPDRVPFVEDGVRYEVDLRRGHKTGFYLDQRENRALLRALANGREVLNAFSYTGGFGLAALAGGAARVTNVDSSGEALAQARAHAALNTFDEARFECIEDDVFHYLRRCRDAGKAFDAIVLDPPKFAASAGQVDRAARGYKDINLLAFKLLRPGGLLMTFSCSGHVPPPLFQKIVADAALDAGRDGRIVRFLSQAPDHPVGTAFPEGHYLKGLLCEA
jgi:23S rRNA (cytosine1962-C5)-methyltransferase